MNCPLCTKAITRGQPFIQSFTMEPHPNQENLSVVDGMPQYYADLQTDHGGVHVKCLLELQHEVVEVRQDMGRLNQEYSSTRSSLVMQGGLKTWGC
jgi:hypothetical protein